jgi:N-acetylglutamate synthase-like GNAT family acetyltransferase
VAAPYGIALSRPPCSLGTVETEMPTHRCRRATVDDLPALQALWQQAGLPWEDLDRFVTEFQVVELSEGGRLVGAIGLQVDGSEGLVHSEAIADGEEADPIRAALWCRLQIVARNLGAVRLWTLEDAPYWRTVFAPALPDQVVSMSASFRDPEAAWWTFQLVDPARAEQLAREQMALLSTSLETEKVELQDSVRKIRTLLFTIAGIVLGIMMIVLVYVLLHWPALRRHFGM